MGQGFLGKYSDLFDHPVMKGFLEHENNYELLKRSIENPSKKNQDILDNAFREFFTEIRLINYISQLIYYNHLNLKKSIQKDKYRFPLILDQPVNSEEDDKPMPMKETIAADPLDRPDERLEYNPNEFEEQISDPRLYEVFKTLTSEQKKVLKFYYIHGLNDRQIGKRIGITQQSISKQRLKAIRKIRLKFGLTGKEYEP